MAAVMDERGVSDAVWRVGVPAWCLVSPAPLHGDVPTVLSCALHAVYADCVRCWVCHCNPHTLSVTVFWVLSCSLQVLCGDLAGFYPGYVLCLSSTGVVDMHTPYRHACHCQADWVGSVAMQ